MEMSRQKLNNLYLLLNTCTLFAIHKTFSLYRLFLNNFIIYQKLDHRKDNLTTTPYRDSFSIHITLYQQCVIPYFYSTKIKVLEKLDYIVILTSILQKSQHSPPSSKLADVHAFLRYVLKPVAHH